MKGHKPPGSQLGRRWRLLAALGALVLVVAFTLLRPVRHGACACFLWAASPVLHL